MTGSSRSAGVIAGLLGFWTVLSEDHNFSGGFAGVAGD